jgi:predicted dehydrogenase
MYDLVGFAGRNIDKTLITSKQFECEALQSYQLVIDRNDIDLIYIPLPNSMHKEWVIKSLNSGKHVICEKSLGCSYSEVEEMVAAARRNEKLLFENFQFRFHSQHQIVKKMLEDGEIGETRSFRSSFGFPPFQDSDNIRYRSELGGGALLDAGAYTVKAAHFIMGEDLEVKAATLNVSRDLGVDIYGGIYMQNANGQFAELSYGFDNYYQCNYEIWGSKGKLSVTRAFTAPPGFAPTVIVEKQGYKEEKILPADDHFANMLSHVVWSIENKYFEIENSQNLIQARKIEDVKERAGRSV